MQLSIPLLVWWRATQSVDALSCWWFRELYSSKCGQEFWRQPQTRNPFVPYIYPCTSFIPIACLEVLIYPQSLILTKFIYFRPAQECAYSDQVLDINWLWALVCPTLGKIVKLETWNLMMEPVTTRILPCDAEKHGESDVCNYICIH